MLYCNYILIYNFTAFLKTSDLIKGGKIVNQEPIIVQHRAAYHSVCFCVGEIVWHHIQTHRSTNYKVIRLISLITSDSLIK